MTRAAFGPERTIVWLASYPKSGNTWLRALLTACLFPDEPLDLDNLTGGPLTLDRLALDDFAAIDSSLYTPQALIPYQAAYHRAFASSGAQPTFVKTHSKYTTAPDGTSLFPQEASAGAVLIVRDPIDIVASYAHHEGKTPEQIVERMADDAAMQDAWTDRSSPSLPQHLASWSANVSSWLDQHAVPVHLVRYEDLLSDPSAQLRAVLHFCDLAMADSVIEQAVETCRFAELRAAELAAGFSEKPQSGRAFFRSGKSGGGREEMPPTLIRRIFGDHGATMQRLGYCKTPESMKSRNL